MAKARTAKRAPAPVPPPVPPPPPFVPSVFIIERIIDEYDDNSGQVCVLALPAATPTQRMQSIIELIKELAGRMPVPGDEPEQPELTREQIEALPKGKVRALAEQDATLKAALRAKYDTYLARYEIVEDLVKAAASKDDLSWAQEESAIAAFDLNKELLEVRSFKMLPLTNTYSWWPRDY